jgi:hypothetical protein
MHVNAPQLAVLIFQYITLRARRRPAAKSRKDQALQFPVEKNLIADSRYNPDTWPGFGLLPVGLALNWRGA